MAEYAHQCPKLPWMINFFSTEEGHIPKQQLQAVYNENRLDYLTQLNYQSKPARKRLTSIMCTLGPKSSDILEIEQMLLTGMDVARLKMPYFTKEECATMIHTIREACDNYSQRIGSMVSVAIALDLTGPEIRTGMVRDSSHEVEFKAGDHTCLTSDPFYEEQVTKDVIYVDYQAINNVVEPGDKVKINNSVTLSAIEIVGSFIRCVIERAGSISDRAAVLLENSFLQLPNVSPDELQLAIEQKVDMVIVSYVRNKDIIQEVQHMLGEEGKHIQIIAKIEELGGVKNINEIIKAADAIFLSRADLEQVTKPEKLFIMQKQIIAECNKKGKTVIVAPQVLDSMKDNAEPTKAEIMDVTNCILDGADCLALSRETAAGNYCVEAITTLSSLCREAESVVHQRQVFLDLTRETPWPFEPIYALCTSVVEASMKSNAASIILLTTSGRTAQVVARYRPRCPIIAITRHGFVARKLRLIRAVESIHFVKPPLHNWDDDVRRRIQFGITYGKYFDFIRAGDTIVVLNGTRAGSGFTNSMTIYYASDFDTVNCVSD